MDGKWTTRMVADRLEEAASTIRRLPVAGLKPKGYKSAWPEVIQDALEACGEQVIVRLGPPPADAITRMDEAMEWLRWLEPDQVRLVWMMAENVPRKLICAKVGMSRMTAWRVWKASLMTIASTINVSRRAMQSDENKNDVFRREYLRTGNASDAYRQAFSAKGLSDGALRVRAFRLVKKLKIVQEA